MKKIYAILLVAIAVIIGTSSCTKEGQFKAMKKVSRITTKVTCDGEIVPNESGTVEFTWDGRMLSKLTYINIEGQTDHVVNYSYDSKKRVTEITSSDGNVLKYEYYGKLLQAIKWYVNDQLYRVYTMERSGNFLTSVKVTDAETKSTMPNLTLNPFFFLPDDAAKFVNNSVKKMSDSKSSTGYITFVWDGLNLTQIQYVASNVETYQYEYDSFLNPLRSWFDIMASNWTDIRSFNNVVRRTGTYDDTELDPISFKITYTGMFPACKTWSQKKYDFFGTAYQYEYEETYEY